jgi:Uma2 family endonuclease
MAKARPLTESLKVVTPENVHYPDALVICTPVQPTDDQIRDPVVIVEVLSRSTGDRDRGAKWSVTARCDRCSTVC